MSMKPIKFNLKQFESSSKHAVFGYFKLRRNATLRYVGQKWNCYGRKFSHKNSRAEEGVCMTIMRSTFSWQYVCGEVRLLLVLKTLRDTCLTKHTKVYEFGK